MNNRVPVEAFSPGEYLRDELDARNWTQTEFAQIIARPTRLVNEIIAGKRGITPETAKELSAAFGTSDMFWMNLESAFQLSKARPASNDIARRVLLREKFPVRDMIKRGWLPDAEDLTVLEKSALSFFGLTSLEQDIHFPHAARRNYAENVSPLQWAWLFRVKQLADVIPSKPYSADGLRSAIAKMEALLTEPEEGRHVAKILADCGVRFVVVEPLPGSKTDGVCFWLDQQSPVVGMTLRFDRNDNFWFVLRHELEHILRNHANNGLILDEDLGDGRNVSVEEEEANTASQEFCVPPRELTDFVARVRPYFSEEKITKFSKRIKRHPGIVIGQLQNYLSRPDLLNKMKVKIRKIIAASAFTDGWGQEFPVLGGKNGVV